MTWIPFKQWCAEEGEREGVSPAAISSRVRKGLYVGLKIKRVNPRVWSVAAGTGTYWRAPKPGEVRLSAFVITRAYDRGVSRAAVWMEVWRLRKKGQFVPGLKLRHVSPRTIYVSPAQCS